MTRRQYGDGSVTFDARKNLWVVRIDLGRGANGQRRRPTRYAKTEAAGWKVLKTLQTQTGAGQVVATAVPTVAAFLETWFDTHTDELAASTRRAYRHAIDYWLVGTTRPADGLPNLGRAKVADLSKTDVQDWLNAHKKASGPRRRIGLAHACLRSALATAVGVYLTTNPAKDLRVPGVAKTRRGQKRDRAVTRFLTVPQAKTFRAVCATHRLGALFTVALACGLRLGEACGLSWDDVDLETGRIKIWRQLQRVERGRLVLVDLKTEKSVRTLTLPPFAVAALRAYRKAQLEARLKAGARWTDRGLVFSTFRPRANHPAGAPLQPRNVNRLMNELLDAAELPRAVTFHGLRHSAASLLIAAGEDLIAVSQLLGHSEIRITADFYTHLVDQTAARAALKMEGILE
jgi:integrase